MEIDTTRYKRCDVVKAIGRIDSQTAPRLAESFRNVAQDGRFRIVFDMSGVDFITSAGLRVLIEAQKTCKRWNRGRLVLASVPRRIYEALDLAGFVPLFDIFDGVVAAVGSF